MKFVRYADNGTATLGVFTEENHVVPLRHLLDQAALRRPAVVISPAFVDLVLSQPKAFLVNIAMVEQIVEEALLLVDEPSTQGLSDLEVLPIVDSPEKIVGVSYNYSSFRAAEGVEEAAEPQLFGKLPSGLVGPHATIHVPPAVRIVDFEAELCVVVGRPARNVSVEEAVACIAGYTVVNELTAKILPRPATDLETIQLKLKGNDNLAPIGAVFASRDEFPTFDGTHINCHINGEQRQHFRVDGWVNSPAEIISYASGLMTLRPGDLISMGTSEGIGIVEVPPRLLEDGDEMEVFLDNIPGTRNVIRFSKDEARYVVG